MGFSLGDFISGKWFVMLGIGGAFLIYAALFMDPAVDRAAVGLFGVALVAFGCARAECMTIQQSFVDARYTPSGVGAMKAEKPLHRVTRTGAALYAMAAGTALAGAVRLLVVHLPV